MGQWDLGGEDLGSWDLAWDADSDGGTGEIRAFVSQLMRGAINFLRTSLGLVRVFWGWVQCFFVFEPGCRKNSPLLLESKPKMKLRGQKLQRRRVG